MLEGTVTRYNSDKGFGSLRVQGDSDWFFHVSSCADFEPETGQKVTFDTGENRGRPCAVNVQLVSGSE
jgi:cold shock CspA family protein